jgi:hypothetical protein
MKAIIRVLESDSKPKANLVSNILYNARIGDKLRELIDHSSDKVEQHVLSFDSYRA